ncbi:MAG: DEAD/DEAH box helicase [Kofleriaceae bacterium]|nr:DEAD/DEAH box helicase [Kofleriaceae bacterium]
MPFAALGLSAPLVHTTSQLGYEVPTQVQLEAIPAILRGDDVWACAATGSGKTAAFVLPLLDRLSRPVAVRAQHDGPGPRPVRVLLLVPTRELAMQITAAVQRYGRELPMKLKTCALIGGVSENPQMMALRGGADIVIATPGRLLDLIRKNALTLHQVETVVLDEADRLLSLGFGDELAQVRALVPQRVQTLLFSATFPDGVKALAARLLQSPTRIQVAVEQSPLLDTLVQRAIEVDVAKRTPLLCELLKTQDWPQVLVFVASRYAADHVVDKLANARITAAALHGELSQGRRTDALADFKAKRIQVLVATDVAARGIDIVSLPVVVNYDLPRSPVDYLHRVGRTARAGATGLAVNLITVENAAHFRLIEKRHKFAVAREQIPGFEPTVHTAPPGDPHGGIKGKRPNKKDKLRAAAAANKPPGSNHS